MKSLLEFKDADERFCQIRYELLDMLKGWKLVHHEDKKAHLTLYNKMCEELKAHGKYLESIYYGTNKQEELWQSQS